MKILVTGGAGFIGSHVAEVLLEEGHDIVVFDNLSTGKKENLVEGLTLVEGDIQNTSDLETLFNSHQFDAIFHLAAQIDVRASVNDPLADAEANIFGTLKLLELARKHRIKKFIFSSTGGAIYGDTDVRPTPETHAENPLSPYGISKLAIDKYLRFYQDQGLQTISLRYGNVYGPRQNPHGEAGVVAIFLQKMLSGTHPTINGDGEQTRDYVFVGDVAKANLLALESTVSGTYNIGTGQETSVNTLFSFINNHFEDRFSEEHGSAKPGEQKTSCLDASLALSNLNWQPTVNLEDGIAQTYEWFRNNS